MQELFNVKAAGTYSLGFKRLNDELEGSTEFRIVFWDVLPCKIIVDRRFRRTDDGGSTYL
jgi:hypothetical protein